MKIVSLLKYSRQLENLAILTALLLSVCGLSRAQQRAKGPTDYPTLPEGVSVQKDIHYGRYAGTILDVLQPKAHAPGLRPAVIVFHGGGWIHSGKETAYTSLCLPYLERGFVVVNVEYRVASEAIAPAAVTDALNATQWLFKHAKQNNIDPKRVVVTGGSAGGHLALMVGMTPKAAHLGPVNHIAVVIDGYGPTDVVDLLNGPHHQDWATQWIPEQPNRVELARRVSPLTYVRHELPPIFIAQGAEDHTVPVEQSVRLHNALDLAGVANEIAIVPNAKHGFSREQWGPLDEKIFSFLKAHGIEGPEHPLSEP